MHETPAHAFALPEAFWCVSYKRLSHSHTQKVKDTPAGCSCYQQGGNAELYGIGCPPVALLRVLLDEVAVALGPMVGVCKHLQIGECDNALQGWTVI